MGNSDHEYDGVYQSLASRAYYRLEGDKVMIQNPEKRYRESSGMDRWHMQMLLDNGLIYRKQ